LKPPYYIGLMSGTSLDGIDGVIVTLGDNNTLELVTTHLEPLPPLLKSQVLNFCQTGVGSLDALGELDLTFAQLFVRTVKQLLEKSVLLPSDIVAIGCSGQTIRHQPNRALPFTLQIGDANYIAKNTGITVISDFRRADIALGGQGAPLVPKFHHWITPKAAHAQVVLNIGGIANITFIPPYHFGPVLGYDTGPGNALMDAWCEQHWGKPFDKNGAYAKKGTCNPELLQSLLSDPYFLQPAPKSTGKEKFHVAWLESHLNQFGSLSPEDIQTTLLELTAQSICRAVMSHPDVGHLWICGGGAHNDTLIARIRALLPASIQLSKTEEFGLPADWVEAACFAWLAKARLENMPANLPSVTGASQETTLGAIYSFL
jgi:anhydro-N-acetylmuramic acid kinase